MKRVVLFLVSIVLCPAAAPAQARFQTGVFAWTPTITLRDAGFDTNVFDEARDPKRDTVAILTPRVDGLVETGTWSLAVSGHADFVYFEHYTNERSINRGTTGRLDLQLSRVRPFVAAGYLDTRERQNSEIDLRARRSERDVSAGARVQVLSRTAFEVSVRRADLNFREGQVFRAQDLAERLNRASTSAAGRMLVELSPLTTLNIEGTVSRDRFAHRPLQDTDNVRVTTGFEFAPDAIIRGRASLGYHQMAPRGPEALGFRGFIAGVDLSYVLLGRTRFDARVSRDTTYSLEQQPYFLQTVYGGEVTHNVIRPVDLIGRFTREWLDYPGIPERNLSPHLDHLNRYGGGVAIRPSERLRLSVNYEFAERVSGESVDLSFDRRRMYTVITYGF